MSDIEKMNLESENLVDKRIEQMRELFPEVFAEGGGVILIPSTSTS